MAYPLLNFARLLFGFPFGFQITVIRNLSDLLRVLLLLLVLVLLLFIFLLLLLFGLSLLLLFRGLSLLFVLP